MGENNALPDATFVFQDSEGVMWLASFDGLYYYDGTSYIPFRYNPLDSTSLSGNRINSVHEDDQKRLWVGTVGYGLNVSDQRKRSFKRVPLSSGEEEDNLNITGIVQDQNGRIWITTENGLIVLQERENGLFEQISLKEISASDAPAHQYLRNAIVLKDHSDRIWLGTQNGLYRFNTDHSWLTPADFKSLIASPIHDIELDAQGSVWVSTNGENRLYHYDDHENQFSPLDNIPFASRNAAIKFCFDADNRLWASEFGAALLGYDLKKQHLFLDSRVNSNVQYLRFWRSPYLDDSGNIWVCGDGVLKYSYPKGFNSYIHGLQFDNSSSAIHIDDNSIWMAFREVGVIDYDLRSGETKLFSTSAHTQNKLHSDLVYSIASIDKAVKVLGSYGVVEVMIGNQIVQTHRVAGAIRAIHRDDSGRVWASGYNGLYELDIAENTLRHVDMSADLGRGPYYFQSVVHDEIGNLWIATESRGLIYYNVTDDILTQYTPTSNLITLPSWRINDLAVDLSGNLWIGTDLGLLSFHQESGLTTLYNSNNNLINDFISSVVVEDSTHIWVSTNFGLGCLDTKSSVFKNYGNRDGLNNVFYYPRAKALASNGYLYFGGRDGIDFFHPDNLRQNPYAPKLKITTIEVPPTFFLSPTEHELKSGWTFSHNTDFINLQFAGLHYSSPENVLFAYKIEGLKDEWTDIGSERGLALTGLSPGDYKIHLRATSPDGVMSESEVTVPLTIRQPFWRTALFRICAAGLVLAFIFYAFKQRETRIMSKEQQRLEVNKQMLDLEKKALLAQMNPHFIFNAMNSIQQYIYSGDNAGAMKYLTKFSRLLRNVLHVSSQSLIPLYDEIQLIRDYIELERMRFPDKFDFTISVDPKININSVEISPFLIQPQVENAILHGLLNKPTHGSLKIDIGPSDSQNIKVTVEDDGIGRDKAVELQLSKKFKHAGKATTIVRKRLMHNEYVNGRTPYEIIDLYNDKNEAIGTRVEMLIHTH